MIYGELGVIPISVQAECRLLIFWAKLVNGTECKLSNIFCFKNEVQLRTKDQFRQNWASEVFDSSKCLNYRMFKTNFKYENYLSILEDSQRIVFTKCEPILTRYLNQAGLFAQF